MAANGEVYSDSGNSSDIGSPDLLITARLRALEEGGGQSPLFGGLGRPAVEAVTHAQAIDSSAPTEQVDSTPSELL